MKPIDDLNNVAKAKLLHELFPQEIPAFIQFVENMCLTIQEEADRQRTQWNNGLFTFDFWLSLVAEAQRKIQRYQAKLPHNASLFADQLFDGYLSVFLIHCLTLYTTVQQHPNRQFVLAVELLFTC
ncbi:MAG: hypothetical protein JSU01_19770 [Bacteroidetes bacterium]|nr:hypothetical protein [Bacteroidota bacterium]